MPALPSSRFPACSIVLRPHKGRAVGRAVWCWGRPRPMRAAGVNPLVLRPCRSGLGGFYRLASPRCLGEPLPHLLASQKPKPLCSDVHAPMVLGACPFAWEPCWPPRHPCWPDNENIGGLQVVLSNLAGQRGCGSPLFASAAPPANPKDHGKTLKNHGICRPALVRWTKAGEAGQKGQIGHRSRWLVQNLVQSWDRRSMNVRFCFAVCCKHHARGFLERARA
jgi:hypothetical protein